MKKEDLEYEELKEEVDNVFSGLKEELKNIIKLLEK